MVDWWLILNLILQRCVYPLIVIKTFLTDYLINGLPRTSLGIRGYLPIEDMGNLQGTTESYPKLSCFITLLTL